MYLLVYVRAFYCTCFENLYVCTAIKFAYSVAIVRRHSKNTHQDKRGRHDAALCKPVILEALTIEDRKL